VFLNEVIRAGMVHKKLQLGAQKMSISTIPHNISFGYLDHQDTRNYTADFVLNVKPLELCISDIESGLFFCMNAELLDILSITRIVKDFPIDIFRKNN
jgi:hypothetical protein